MFSVMKFSLNRLQINIQPSFWFSLAVLVILIPIRWLLSWMIAASIHEIFHLIALKLFDYRIIRLSIGSSGAFIETNMEKGLSSVVCAFAGPISGFILLPFVNSIPRIAICGVFQSLCNLIPLYPLDGGRMVEGIIYAIFKKKTAQNILNYYNKTILVVMTLLLLFTHYHYDIGFIPIILLLFVLIKKYLANNNAWRYNITKEL